MITRRFVGRYDGTALAWADPELEGSSRAKRPTFFLLFLLRPVHIDNNTIELLKYTLN